MTTGEFHMVMFQRLSSRNAGGPPGFAALLGAALVLSACSSVPVEERSDVRDRYEGANRKVFAFNQGVDSYVLEPVPAPIATRFRKAGRRLSAITCAGPRCPRPRSIPPFRASSRMPRSPRFIFCKRLDAWVCGPCRRRGRADHQGRFRPDTGVVERAGRLLPHGAGAWSPHNACLAGPWSISR